MTDKVKITAMVMSGLALFASWHYGIDPTLQKTFLSIFLATIAWTPGGMFLRAVARPFTKE